MKAPPPPKLMLNCCKTSHTSNTASWGISQLEPRVMPAEDWATHWFRTLTEDRSSPQVSGGRISLGGWGYLNSASVKVTDHVREEEGEESPISFYHADMLLLKVTKRGQWHCVMEWEEPCHEARSRQSHQNRLQECALMYQWQSQASISTGRANHKLLAQATKSTWNSHLLAVVPFVSRFFVNFFCMNLTLLPFFGFWGADICHFDKRLIPLRLGTLLIDDKIKAVPPPKATRCWLPRVATVLLTQGDTETVTHSSVMGSEQPSACLSDKGTPARAAYQLARMAAWARSAHKHFKVCPWAQIRFIWMTSSVLLWGVWSTVASNGNSFVRREKTSHCRRNRQAGISVSVAPCGNSTPPKSCTLLQREARSPLTHGLWGLAWGVRFYHEGG